MLHSFGWHRIVVVINWSDKNSQEFLIVLNHWYHFQKERPIALILQTSHFIRERRFTDWNNLIRRICLAMEIKGWPGERRATLWGCMAEQWFRERRRNLNHQYSSRKWISNITPEFNFNLYPWDQNPNMERAWHNPGYRRGIHASDILFPGGWQLFYLWKVVWIMVYLSQ